jgi:phage shock protein PspC (stress-responsive transcriptional regulator)
MQKVITINLHGNAYQLDEPGYDTLRAYLNDAEARLEGNPDRAEIVVDLEQAVAEKCLRYLGRGKTVVSTAEIEQILREIGPVDGGGATAQSARSSSEARERAASDPAAKHLYQIREGAMISGVCNGLAAYFNIDPTFVRVGFVLLALFHGVGILLYILLMVLVPYAKTSEELAAAQGGNAGVPYRVQKFVEKLRRKVMEKPWWKKKTRENKL